MGRGGPETVVRALLDAVGPNGTVAAVASWCDIPLRLDEMSPEHRRAYREEMPGFDPEHSEANPRYGRLPERLRSWPGSFKSAHPDQRVVAVGPRGGWLTHPHPLDDSFGEGTPFARLVEAGGQVLMLGGPAAVAHAASSRGSHRRRPAQTTPHILAPLRRERGSTWRTLHDIDVE